MILVSSCLVGQNCRYNGQSKKNDKVLSFLKNKTYITFCPEGILGTPREAMSFINNELIGNISQKNYTKQVKDFSNNFLKSYVFSTAILKARSPSCAIYTYSDGNENGLFTQMLLKKYPSISLKDEEQIINL